MSTMNRYIAFFFVLAFGCFSHPCEMFAEGASLYLSPDSGMYSVGDNFTVDIKIDTGGEGVGTADVTIVYDPNDVSFVSVSDEGSVFGTIVVDSTRKEGEVDISGFVGRGGESFVGTDGLFAHVSFLPKRNVASQFYFSKGAMTPPFLTASVGTLISDVLSDLSLRTATYTFVPKETLPATVLYASAAEEFEITPLPVPSTEWFATTSVKLSWTLPEGVTEMRTTVSDDLGDTPSKLYPIPVSSVELNELEEGTSYFLLQFSRSGEWGGVIQYPLKVDLTSPEYIVVREAER